MSSDFVSEETGLLRYADAAWEIKKQDPEMQAKIAATSEEAARRAGSVFNVSTEGYYNSEKFLEDVDKACDIVDLNSGGERKPIFLMDNSPIHCKKGDDVLNAKRMNVGTGGKQPMMEDGWFMLNGVKVRSFVSLIFSSKILSFG
jgi:hypothetical protein